MSREFSVVIERDEEGYYVASVPALPGCHTAGPFARRTDGPGAGGDRLVPGGARPRRPADWTFIGVQRVSVPA